MTYMTVLSTNLQHACSILKISSELICKICHQNLYTLYAFESFYPDQNCLDFSQVLVHFLQFLQFIALAEFSATFFIQLLRSK